MRRQEDLLLMTREEILRQDKKWGADRILDDGYWSLIIQEELGEVAKDCLHENYAGAVTELVEVAAVALQWASCIGRMIEEGES